MPVLERFSAEVDVVISGHTHQPYLCEYRHLNPAKPFLLSSAGHYGTVLTEVVLTVDTRKRRVADKKARQIIVQGEAIASERAQVPLQPQFPVFAADKAVGELVSFYGKAAEPLAAKSSGVIAASASRALGPAGESVLGRMVADSMLHATRDAAAGGAQIAFMNSGGVRADLVPASNSGEVSYGQLYAVLPFGNHLVVQSYSGAQLRRLLEQQFASGTNTVTQPRILQVSDGFSYAFDLSQPEGRRIQNMRLGDMPIENEAIYRVAIQSYLSTGGDNFPVFTEGRDAMGGMLDLDALVGYLSESDFGQPMPLPTRSRIVRVN
ncbi:Trifunctional nucleotide phosphoesterase protein YfkN [bioreactor metagenome]|uniref:Trifunctional nucleotide phosphoesterase protein YfkN n=1 Tax=bioreactor metagenome TaxID=1076179 RepID=A0A645DMU2_9ZZZZ